MSAPYEERVSFTLSCKTRAQTSSYGIESSACHSTRQWRTPDFFPLLKYCFISLSSFSTSRLLRSPPRFPCLPLGATMGDAPDSGMDAVQKRLMFEDECVFSSLSLSLILILMASFVSFLLLTSTSLRDSVVD